MRLLFILTKLAGLRATRRFDSEPMLMRRSLVVYSCRRSRSVVPDVCWRLPLGIGALWEVSHQREWLVNLGLGDDFRGVCYSGCGW